MGLLSVVLGSVSVVKCVAAGDGGRAGGRPWGETLKVRACCQGPRFQPWVHLSPLLYHLGLILPLLEAQLLPL